MSIEAMKQALEALDTCHWDYDSEEESYKTFDEDLVNDASEALRQAIEQAEKDDMYRNPDTGNPCEGWNPSDMAHRSGGLSVEQAEKQEHKPWCDYLNIMLPSLPPQKAKCNCKQAEKQEKLCKYCGGIGRVVCDGRCMPEQEKESTAQTVDPRVLLISNGDFTKETGNRLCDIERRLAVIETQPDEATSKKPHAVSYKDGVPVAHYNFDPPPYTAPPRKEWVGLTDEDVSQLIGGMPHGKMVRAIEAKLRERNT
jgi:hypothetical protein